MPECNGGGVVNGLEGSDDTYFTFVNFVAFYAVSVNGFNGATCNDP